MIDRHQLTEARRRKRPTECEKCKPFVNPIMELEARHILATEGPSAAQSFFDEELEDVHAGH